MSSLLTAAAIEVGKVVAKSIFKLWVKDDALSDMSANLLDLMSTKTEDPIAQRAGDRQFQEIGDKISMEILPLLEQEGASIDEGEREATARAIADTLGKARLSRELLLQHNLQPTQLEHHILSSHPNATQHLNQAASQLYTRIIKECCTYIVDIASQLPSFNERTFGEILRRGDQLGKKVDDALAELRKIREHLDPSKAADRFEKEYREAIARNLDVLNLIGADVSLLNRRHKLSVAYISLSVVRTRSASDKVLSHYSYRVNEDESEDGDDDEVSTLPVESVLASSKRLLIRGLAGSGKTTLLQWIAVRAATNSFEGELAAWNGKLPFYIRLRRYAQMKLPRPEAFPEFDAAAIFNMMPAHWVHDMLETGRVLILVDGVDEVSATQREDVHTWLRDLIGTYGKCNFIVTSRPHAIEKGWMNHEAFDEALLQDMELPDIYSFIEHWHDAVKQELQSDEEKKELAPLAEHIKQQVNLTRSVRNLATNPLLCAMLCALNRERRQQLPVNRLELYEACSSLLLERREKESKIDLSDYPALSYSQKLRLLQDLAYWMIHEDLSEAETTVVDDRFNLKLGDMPNAAQDISGKMVRKLFVERAAILREPVDGRIDFTHRTFEEFFAAQAIARVGSIKELVAHAHNDQWREVIIMAAGFVAKPLCEQLVQDLIARGDKEKKLRYQLHLLAVACLETAIELGVEVRAEVEKRLSNIVPPRNITDAKSLAVAGELAVKYLDKKRLLKKEKLSATTCAACVRALSLIGGEAALDILEGYAEDEREKVTEELVKAWSKFDQEHYARRIITKRYKYQKINFMQISNLPSLDGMQYLTTLGSLMLYKNGQINDLGPLAGLSNLSSLYLWGCEQVSDLGPLAGLSNLSSLDLSGCKQVSDLGPLAGLSNLSSLNLSGCEQVSDLRPLAGLSNLSSLDLSGCEQVSDLGPLAGLSNLSSLNLWGCEQVSDLNPLVGLNNLRELRLARSNRFKDLDALSKLENLRIIRYPSIIDVE